MKTKQKPSRPRPVPENEMPKQKAPPPPPAAGNGSQPDGDRLEEKQLLSALTAFKRGDFSVRLPDDWTGLSGKIADTFNDVIGMNQRLGRGGDPVGAGGGQ